MVWLVLVVAVLISPRLVVRDVVDVTEINRFYYGEDEKEVIVQIIWWNWYSWDQEYRVVDWRLLKDTGQPLPSNGLWRTAWYDVRTKTYREVISKVLRESQTLYDREEEDQKMLPAKRRRGLMARPKAILKTQDYQ